MSTALNYHDGGWAPEHAATGISPTVVRLVGWVTAASAAFTATGTGGELSIGHLQQQSTHQTPYTAPTLEFTDTDLARTPTENLARIREVLNPAISDLATTFGVSRQSVYNWLNGGAVSEENADKLRDLAQAADLLVHEDVTVNSTLLKRKLFNGQTLMQVAQAGGSTKDAAQKLVQISKREAAQRERIASRFSSRVKTPATADFDLPSPNDEA